LSDTQREANSAPLDHAPLLRNKHYEAPSVFSPEALLKVACLQKSLPAGQVPEVCVLDPDGDILRDVLRREQAIRHASWACYHTDLYQITVGEVSVGLIGNAVGGSFAVLLAEQLFASGCRLLVSITSAGQILPTRKPPYFVLIDRALRDEGTSLHYLPASKYAFLNQELAIRVHGVLKDFSPAVARGAAWTTDAPYRETEQAIAYAQGEGILAVEMEAASLYAFAQARQKPVVCFAHVTNQMGTGEGDFEKGESDGSVDALRLLAAIVTAHVETRSSTAT
jgi:uridine phosphorylase